MASLRCMLIPGVITHSVGFINGCEVVDRLCRSLGVFLFSVLLNVTEDSAPIAVLLLNHEC